MGDGTYCMLRCELLPFAGVANISHVGGITHSDRLEKYRHRYGPKSIAFARMPQASTPCLVSDLGIRKPSHLLEFEVNSWTACLHPSYWGGDGDLVRSRREPIGAHLMIVSNQQKVSDEHGMIPCLAFNGRGSGELKVFVWCGGNEGQLTRLSE